MAKRNRRKRRSNRSSASNPAQWFADWISGGVENESGVSVNRETALTYAAVWRAVNLIATDVAKLPLILYRKNESGKEPATNHPSFKLLRHKPNALMTAFTLRQTMQADALLNGSGYAYIVRDKGKITEIVPLSATDTYPEVTRGSLVYWHWRDGQRYPLPPEDVIHIRGLSPDGITPYSVFDKARESLGLGLAARKYGARFFKNNARPTTILKHPNKLSQEAAMRLREGWKRAYGGEQQNGTAVLEEGMDATFSGFSNNDAQFLETRQFEIREIASWFGVPPHKLGDNTRTAYSSLEQENQRYLDECLDGWLCAWEEELFDKLLSPAEKESDSHLIEFKRQALMRANLIDRYNAYSIAINNRIMNPNEVRSLENMNAYDGGDEFLVPKNIGNPGGDPVTTEKPAEVPAEPVADDAPDDSAYMADRLDALEKANRALVMEACRRAIHRLATDTRRAAEAPNKFLASIDEIQSRHLKIMSEILSPVVESLRLAGPTLLTADVAAAEYLAEYQAGILALAGRCKAAELASRTAFYLDDLERSGPPALAARLQQIGDSKMPVEKRITEHGGCKIETRDGGGRVLVGYGAVFYDPSDAGTEYQLWPGVVERIAVGAFDKVIVEKQDVRGLYNHDPNYIFGRTRSGTMRLSVDARGLRYEIDLPDTNMANDLAASVMRGDVDGSSFGFQVSRESWQFSESGDVRTIEEVSPLYDTGPVVFPAYEGTTAGVRSAFLRAAGESGDSEKYVRQRYESAKAKHDYTIHARLRVMQMRSCS